MTNDSEGPVAALVLSSKRGMPSLLEPDMLKAVAAQLAAADPAAS